MLSVCGSQTMLSRHRMARWFPMGFVEAPRRTCSRTRAESVTRQDVEEMAGGQAWKEVRALRSVMCGYIE